MKLGKRVSIWAEDGAPTEVHILGKQSTQRDTWSNTKEEGEKSERSGALKLGELGLR